MPVHNHTNISDMYSFSLFGINNVNINETYFNTTFTTVLIIDLQKGEYNSELIKERPQDNYMWDRIKNVVLPNGKKIIEKCRQNKIEVIFTVIESYTKDGRDRGIDYKISGIFCPKNSKEAEVIDEIKPLDNEIIIPKTSSSVFNSTNIEYVLRNLSIQYLMIFGIVTDQCVETAVRDGCDKGFLITLIEDACATHTQEQHNNKL